MFVLVLPVFLFIVQSTIQNKHTHFYPNGIVVTHSHPLPLKNGEPQKEHGHTKTEICFFYQVNFEFFTHTPQYQIAQLTNENQVDFICIDEQINYQFRNEQPVNKGPPSFLF